MHAIGTWSRENWPILVIALGAMAISLGYLITVLSEAGKMSYPLDDAYIYLTYAKQFGSLHPFSYYDGGGYSAGATSPLWPRSYAQIRSIIKGSYALLKNAFPVESYHFLKNTRFP